MTNPDESLPNVPASEPEALDQLTLKKSRGGDLAALMGCNLIVFAASVCIMVLELTASRLIAKHVGSSLYTWTSVIGVVLAGITVGNYIGGWLADRISPRRLLSWLFLVSSVLCFSVLWLDHFVGDISRPEWMEWPTWVVCLVAGVFFLPATGLGTISPVVAALALSRSTRTGITVGNVYAWGALGSIVGTFLTGFYLIDIFGTKAIVGMTSATLAAIGILVAGQQRVFRAVVFFGWLQFVFVFGLAASAESGAFSDFGASVGRGLFGGEEDNADTSWSAFGEDLGRSLHQLGLALALREDDPDEYHDESNYSYINVHDDEEDGDRIKALKLDKLIHSYYNPAEPTSLYYDYEEVYAAVTERAAVNWDRTTSVSLKEAASQAEIIDNLPQWARYDAERSQLEVRGALSAERRDFLLELTPMAAYWRAVEDLYESTNDADWKGFVAVKLEALPEGVPIPRSLDEAEKVQFDSGESSLIAYDVLSEDECDSLLELGTAGAYAGYYRAVHDLYGRSRRVSTLFIGGGGFIFPRWIEAKFPHDPQIDVAELDPAVKLAVQLEMGLPPDDRTAVNTYIGDARNCVDDRLHQNGAARQAGKSEVLYDFVFGDAFNDFSVPWHLTTREFAEKIQRLLAPDGVYMVNIIDIHPRTEYPAEPAEDSSETPSPFEGRIPETLLANSTESGDWDACPAPFASMETMQTEEGGGHRIAVRGAMSDSLRDRLCKLDPKNGEFTEAVEGLYERSRRHEAGRFVSSFVNTIAQVFPNIYVFSSEVGVPHAGRDTFVVVASQRALDLADLGEAGGYWYGEPFAWTESDGQTDERRIGGQMRELAQAARGMILTDDYAPVDNLLSPVFLDQN